uniref:FAD-binding PCMH-type domain-containing protein n=1 Tax=Pyricularia oryzae (strain P131) TaxID=1143193 RepID=L7JKZ7_PYRO1
MGLFLQNLVRKGIEFCETDGRSAPPEAAMHDRGAVVPKFVISPNSEYGVSQTLMLLKDFDLYDKIAISVKSGGHGYFNGDQQSHPGLLYAMRGGAAASVGVVTHIRLRLIDEPPLVTWRFASIDKTQLQMCVVKQAFANAYHLPREITVSFRFHFEPTQLGPVCSFNITSLLTAEKTTESLRQHLGPELTAAVFEIASWNEKALVKLRLLPASDALAADPRMLAEASSTALRTNPLVYWKKTAALREMASSYFASISHWVVPGCEPMFLDLYDAFASVQRHPARQRMCALVVQGGGRILDLQQDCSMPLGQALARFKVGWDDEKEETWCRGFTERVSGIFQSKEDPGPGRPYRGDVWLKDQTNDARLDEIFQQYDRRYV